MQKMVEYYMVDLIWVQKQDIWYILYNIIQIVEKDGRECGCGQKGCLEKYTSANGVAEIAKEYVNSTDTPSILRDLKEITCKDVFDSYYKNDQLSQQIVKYVSSYLSIGCINVCRTFDPQVIVMTGGMAEGGDALFDNVNKEFVKNTWTIAKPEVKILPATAGPHSGIIGAAAVARQQYIDGKLKH